MEHTLCQCIRFTFNHFSSINITFVSFLVSDLSERVEGAVPEKMPRNRLGGCQSVVAEEMGVVWTGRWETPGCCQTSW